MSELDEFLDESQDLLVEEVRKKYSQTVSDHWLHPRNPHLMRDPDGRALREGDCGDDMQIHLRIRNRRVVDASFMTNGCITSIVSGSMVVELVRGKTLPAARAITAQDILDGLDGLPEESEHCAELAAETLRAALDDFLRSDAEPWKRLYRT